MKPLAECVDYFVEIRKAFHSFPELSQKEERTSATIAELLNGWGFEVCDKIGGYGVVGVLRRGTASKSVGLRADFDALPILEETGLEHASQNPGVMHACGHDGHSAILLAACYELARSPFCDGTFVAIFQPAEEVGEGAKAMFQDELESRFPTDAYFGLHNIPGLPAGHFGLAEGPFWAAVDDVTITLKGFGGHAGFPHLARDPVVAACNLGVALQTVVSRTLNPVDPAVLTIGAIHAGEAHNVIPDQSE
ncbi:amidohydrolase [Ruegeria arenilitoris]|uniref:amidohydrolase n=1 Tax=Ruegeria arenilitoris TaxID=1173585 RepID=UPI00147F0AC7|nr:amidohydrolase [Ruegeria arenilitoris]